MSSGRVLRLLCGVLLGFGLVLGCGYDDTLRAYLNAHFWLPFAKRPSSFERRNVKRISAPFAGMMATDESSPLAKLRAAYQQISTPDFVQSGEIDVTACRQALEAVRTSQALTPMDREEVELLDAKIDMREGDPSYPELLRRARSKLVGFLRTARSTAFRSEARGWIAHIDYLLGDQTAAGKIYLDELNRNGSNLSRETLLNSLRMNYGYDGGPELLAHLDAYFDTPEHAAFVIQTVTNPHWDENDSRFPRRDSSGETYRRIKTLIETHRQLLASNEGSNALALLAMRTALRMGDPPAAQKVADMVPAGAPVRSQPDFDWMLAAAHFLAHDYAAAEAPLLALFRSHLATPDQKAAAAYGLCGVYEKTGNVMEQLRYAL